MAATPRAPRPLRPLLLCCLAASARAALVVPQVFSDGCVLQTNAEYGARSFIFGAASPGDAIVVELRDSASHQPLGGNYSTVADATEGAWRVTLNPLSDAMAPFDIVVSDETTGEQHVASGCLAGDIYVNSGQSNIVFQASDALNASALWNASWPNVRLFAVQMTRADAPQRAFPPLNASLHCSWSAASALPCNRWLPADPAYNALFSAVALFTALEVARLHTGTRPVGIILSAYGGTSIAEWAPPTAYSACPAAAASGGELWNAMIAPMAGFSLRSFLWVQGENDVVNEAATPGFYGCRHAALIAHWRSSWAMGDVAFNFAQLGPVVQPLPAPQYGLVRVPQALVLPRPGGSTDITGMAVTYDLGDAASPLHSVHFRNKTEVARRLAAAVLHSQFALQNASLLGPELAGFSAVSASSVTIDVLVADGSGVRLADGGQCTLCCARSVDTVQLSADGGASWANATLAVAASGASVVATALAPAAAPFTHARLAWASYPECAIVANGNGFPLAAFMLPVAAPAADSASAPVSAPALAPAQTAPRRRVNWYLSSGNIADNADLIAKHGDAISGGYLCCGFGGTLANGSWSSQAQAVALAQMAPLTSTAREVWMVSSVAEVAVLRGGWAGSLVEAAAALAPLASAGLNGLIVDYEPSSNYTIAHAEAYAAYLSALAAALKPLGLAVGFDIAGWGVLAQQFWPVYLRAGGISRFTSMTPTYDADNITLNEVFVGQALGAFGPAFAAGVGSVLNAGAPCEWNYHWNASTFPSFVQFMGDVGVATIDVWRCDIDKRYLPDNTASWMLDALKGFLAGAAPRSRAEVPLAPPSEGSRGGALEWRGRRYEWSGSTPPPP